MALLETIRLLPPPARARLRRFLQSPFFTDEVKNHRPENLLQLYDYLLQTPDEAADFDKQSAFAAVFPGKKFAAGTINALSSELHKLVKRFILQTDPEWTDPRRQLLSLARFYGEHGQTERLEKTLHALDSALQETPETEKDTEFLWWRYRSELERCLYLSLYKARTGDLNLGATLHGLDAFYAAGKLEYAANLLNQEQLSGVKVSEALPVGPVLDLIRRSHLSENPLIACFAAATAMLLEPEQSERHFMDFQALLQRHKTALPPGKLKLLYAHERNFCSHQVRQGQEAYLPRLFDLYRRQLEEGMLYENDKLTQGLFQNIVLIALRMKQLDWVESFLEEHRERIAGTRRPDEVYDFNQALYCFHRGDYTGTLRHLRQSYEDNFYVLAANLLELKLYFERKQWDLLDNKLNSFKVNLFKKSRSWLPPDRFHSINQFLNLLRQALHDDVYFHRRPEAVQRLLRKVQDTRAMVERDWLLEKLKAMAEP
jgi:hypothetical protein